MEVFEQKASENKYLHRDFHISMNILMEYISEKFGEGALTEYLRMFSGEFHKERKKLLVENGLVVLKDYFEKVYSEEEWNIEISLSDNELRISQEACPGISHIRKNGFLPIPRYIETYTTIYEELCRETPYEYEMLEFNNDTGECSQTFRRRSI